jgi:hypothetical protein
VKKKKTPGVCKRKQKEAYRTKEKYDCVQKKKYGRVHTATHRCCGSGDDDDAVAGHDLSLSLATTLVSLRPRFARPIVTNSTGQNRREKKTKKNSIAEDRSLEFHLSNNLSLSLSLSLLSLIIYTFVFNIHCHQREQQQPSTLFFQEENKITSFIPITVETNKSQPASQYL